MTDKGTEPVIELDTFAGNHISSVCEKAATMAKEKNKPVHFVFNGMHVTAQPGEDAATLSARWDADHEADAKAWRESPECAEMERKREEENKAKLAAHLNEPAKTESELRDAKVPWPYTETQLTEYIKSLVDRQHDYGTCVYALSMAAEAAFNYVAHQLGVSGFQSSCADLDFVRRTRSLKGPFVLLKAEDMLYPQYDLRGKLQEAMEKWKPWAKEEADKLLAEKTEYTHPDVIRHWENLAGKRGTL